MPVTAPQYEAREPGSAAAASPGKVGRDLPAFPAATGAYVLSGDRWVSLPPNDGHVVQSSGDSFTAKLADEQLEADPRAADTPMGRVAIGRLVFDGRDEPPTVSSRDFVVVFVGSASSASADRSHGNTATSGPPAMELAMLSGAVGSREATLHPVAPRRPGFGPDRVAATVEQPRENVAVLRPETPIARGRYAVLCGTEAFEVTVGW